MKSYTDFAEIVRTDNKKTFAVLSGYIWQPPALKTIVQSGISGKKVSKDVELIIASHNISRDIAKALNLPWAIRPQFFEDFENDGVILTKVKMTQMPNDHDSERTISKFLDNKFGTGDSLLFSGYFDLDYGQQTDEGRHMMTLQANRWKVLYRKANERVH